MKKYCFVLAMLWALYAVPSPADQASMEIGINLQEYPELVVVPDYPVYYAPQLAANYFFYDGEYWVYQNDNWYRSSWYDGPWWIVDPGDVPEFVLRVPVRFYRQPPTYFFTWWSEAPPHWGERWGPEWERRRHGWDKWNHNVHHEPAPLPVYQQHYSGERYPRKNEQQLEIESKNYRYQSHDPVVQQRHQRSNSNVPHASPPHRGGVAEQGSTPVAPKQIRPAVQERKQQPKPEAAQHEQQK
jgi:hypothetical protein